jgi:phage tail sheath protein FI
MQGKPTGGSTVVNGQTVSNYQLANYLIDNIVGTRKDCVAFVSPDDAIVRGNPGLESTSIVNWFGAVNDSTYVIYDTGYKYMYDRYNDVYRYVPLNGDIAGLTARTEATNDAWWSPAGFNRGQIKNIVKLRYNPTKADRDLLYKNAINPVVTFPGQGTVLFGDKTGTKKPSAFDRINVRRLFITLERAISQASRFSLFEFNDEFTRSQFKNLVVPYLRDVQARRGISDFMVVCDATNNTAERIDRNEFWGDIYIKPNRSINFIQLNFVAVRTGVQFSTIIGQF